MTEPAKYFIVATNQGAYSRVIADRRLDPGRCFWCISLDEAQAGREANQRWDIAVVIIDANEHDSPRNVTSIRESWRK
jgi:hypothetical protein